MNNPSSQVKLTLVIASKSTYYAVANGRQTRIYHTWEQCNEQVKIYSNAKFKKFSNYIDAVNFVENHKSYKSAIKTGTSLHQNKGVDALPFLLKQLAMKTATAIKQSCKDKDDILYVQQCFFEQVKKHLSSFSNEES